MAQRSLKKSTSLRIRPNKALRRRHVVRAFPILLLLTVAVAPSQAFDRWVYVDGVVNFRDIGGYRVGTTASVATGLLYRSGTLAYATTDGVRAIEALGVVHIVDLRTTENVAIYPDSPLLDAFTTHTFLPTAFPSDIYTPEGQYVYILNAHGDNWRRFFELLADRSNLPLDYHCWAGKDRTGILTALVLTFLGVERETVIADFMLSNDAYGTTAVMRSWIEAVLDEIDSAGGPVDFLESIGVTEATRQAVCDNLLTWRPVSRARRWSLYE